MHNQGVHWLLARGRDAQREAVRARETAARLCRALARFRRPRVAPPFTLVLTTNAEGIIQNAGAALALWLRMPPRRLSGMPLIQFVARGDVRRLRDVMWRLCRAGTGVIETEARLRPRHGKPALARASVRRVGPDAFEWSLAFAARELGPLEPAS